MLRIAEHWYASDQGRQRQGNEDNLFVRSPLFVVADGMGGAQAGEVASEIAVRSFEPGLPNGTPAEGLVNVIEDANRRIHEMSRAEEQHAGMGTTVTAAYVGEDDVTVAHVGDSRAYLLRSGDLIRLTKDHSLVGELIARGKLTEEQAEQHPQRSVITRALGPEPAVQVDVEIFPAKPDDVFLLCSDGLTSMVPEPGLKPIIEGAGSLEQAGRALIAAANEAGGRDNITVVLFRLESVEAKDAKPAGETVEYETFSGDAVPRQGVSKPDLAPTDEVEAEYRRTGTMVLTAVRPPEAPPQEPRRPFQPIEEPRPPRRRRRGLKAALVVLVIALPVLIGGWIATRAVYFVGVDDQRTVTIYRGLPYELPAGVELYERYAGSGVTIDQVPPRRRTTFTEHKLRSRDDAENLVIALERGQLNR
jgi:serine/threonine protein phosphatase PrpC